MICDVSYQVGQSGPVVPTQCCIARARILVSPDVVVAIAIEHDVDHERQPLDLLQLVEQDHAGNLAVPRKLSELVQTPHEAEYGI